MKRPSLNSSPLNPPTCRFGNLLHRPIQNRVNEWNSRFTCRLTHHGQIKALLIHHPRNNPRNLPLAALEGCYHNGTLYGDGSLVPTMEPCLSCQCNNRTLLCSLRVCHEQPVPPPRGCVIVHHKNKCCPHMFCKRFHKRPMISDMDRKIVNFLDDFEQEQHDIHERYEEFGGDENALRRRSEDPDSFNECKSQQLC